MGIYTIHLKPAAAAEIAANPESVDDSALRGVKIIPECFSWGAFIFGPLWLLRHRLWLALALYALFFAFLWILPGLGEFTGFIPCVVIVAHLYLGVSAYSLREWKLSRSGFRLADVVVARGIDEAARRFFKQRLKLAGEPGQNLGLMTLKPGASLQRGRIYTAEYDVLGLFSRREF